MVFKETSRQRDNARALEFWFCFGLLVSVVLKKCAKKIEKIFFVRGCFCVNAFNKFIIKKQSRLDKVYKIFSDFVMVSYFYWLSSVNTAVKVS